MYGRSLLIAGGLILLLLSFVYFAGGNIVGTILGGVIFAAGIAMLALGARPSTARS